MKKQLLKKIFIISALLAGFAGSSYAQTVYTWTDSLANNQWHTPGNWNIGTAKATTFPGDKTRAGSNTDKVELGVTYFYAFGQRPILLTTDSVSVASVTIGDNSISNGVTTELYIDIEGQLNVTGTILQKHSDNQGFVGNGTITYPSGYDYHIQTWFYGSGRVYCNTFQVGDNTTPLVAGINNITRFNFGNTNNNGIGLTVKIAGDLIVNSVTSNDVSDSHIISVNNTNVSANGGSITVGGTLKLVNTGTIKYSSSQFQPQARFTLSARANNSNTTLYLQGANPLSVSPKDPSTGQIGSNYFDFYLIGNNKVDGTGTTPGVDEPLGTTTVNYCGNVDQKVYTQQSFFATTGINTILESNGGNYDYLVFSGSGKKTIDIASAAIPLVIGADMTLATGTETVDLSTNNPTLLLDDGTNILYNANGQNTNIPQYPTGKFNLFYITNVTTAANTTFQNGTAALTIPGTTTNAGTFNTTTGTVNFNGLVSNSGKFSQAGGIVNINNTYTNTGTFMATAGTDNLNQSGAQSLTDNSTVNVGSTIAPASGGTTFFNLNVQNSGIKTMTGSGRFLVASKGLMTMVANTNLATGDILVLKSDAAGTATLVSVPTNCTISGNATVQRYMSASRAYRLMSSPVYTGNDGTNNIYGINYLRTNTYLNGTGSGFDKVGNPTQYLFRENLAPLYTTFLNSNYRGISDISGTPYGMNDADYPTANIPVANGYLFYFRGSRAQGSLAALTTTGAAATDDTLNAVGKLNVGTIVVHNWYTPASTQLAYTTISNTVGVEGMNLVGNPYASSIDWDKYNTAAIPVTNISKFCYKLTLPGTPGAGNYDIYDAGSTDPQKRGNQGIPNSNIIASGEGFFVQAGVGGGALSFTEAAKTNTVNTGVTLFMGKPAIAAVPQYLRLQMALDSINTDGMVINFGDNSKATFDPSEDATYRAGTGKVSLSSLSSDNVALGINQMPLPAAGQTIALKVGALTSGNYTLNLKEMSGIPQLYSIWLKDAYTKDSVNMRTTKSYSFTINAADAGTFGASRFTLVLSQDPAQAYKLLSFDADKTGSRDVQVVWKASNEQNYTHFTVERSTDGGKNFDVIGSLNSSSEGTYSILDKNPANGENIYRLKQVDFNNVTSYSGVVQIEFTGKSNDLGHIRLNVYPNPAVNNITVDIDPKSQEAATYNIRITNSSGIVVKQAVTSQVNWHDNVSNLFTGTYLVQVVNTKDNTLVGQTKFIKL